MNKTLERDLEQALTDPITETLTELGHGFAFVGQQVHLHVDGDDFYIDLLFFLILCATRDVSNEVEVRCGLEQLRYFCQGTQNREIRTRARRQAQLFA